MAKLREAIWAAGVITVGGEVIPDAVSIMLNMEPMLVSHKQGDNGGEQKWQTGRTINGTIGFRSLTPELFAVLTGGTQTDGATYTRVRKGDEAAIEIVTNDITLGQAGLAVEDTVELFGRDTGIVYKKEDTAVAGSSFSYVAATGVCSFHASETETFIYPQYLYADSTGGSKIEVGKHDVPAEMEFWGTVRSKDLNSLTGSQSDMVMHLARINITSGINIGAESSEETTQYTVEFNAIIDSVNSFELYSGNYA